MGPYGVSSSRFSEVTRPVIYITGKLVWTRCDDSMVTFGWHTEMGWAGVGFKAEVTEKLKVMLWNKNSTTGTFLIIRLSQSYTFIRWVLNIHTCSDSRAHPRLFPAAKNVWYEKQTLFGHCQMYSQPVLLVLTYTDFATSISIHPFIHYLIKAS